MIGVQPILGRGFNAEDQAHDAPVIILSNAYWRKNFGGDEKVLGHTMRLNAQTVTVIGVMPPSMDDPLSSSEEAWDTCGAWTRPTSTRT